MYLTRFDNRNLKDHSPDDSKRMKVVFLGHTLFIHHDYIKQSYYACAI